MVHHNFLGRKKSPARSPKNRQLCQNKTMYNIYFVDIFLGYWIIEIIHEQLKLYNVSIYCMSIVWLCPCSRADCKLTPFICCNFANLLSETGIMNTSEHFCGDFLALNQTFMAMALNVMLDEYMILWSILIISRKNVFDTWHRLRTERDSNYQQSFQTSQNIQI